MVQGFSRRQRCKGDVAFDGGRQRNRDSCALIKPESAGCSKTLKTGAKQIKAAAEFVIGENLNVLPQRKHWEF